MAIIINDHKPDGDTIDVQLPGSKKKWPMKSSDHLTVGDLRTIREGNIDIVIRKMLPEESWPLIDNLNMAQIKELFTAWSGEVKNS